MGILNHRHVCDRCGGAPSRAARTRQVADVETAYYLAFSWACSVCGNSWVDDALERLNAHAEQAARREAAATHLLARRAS
ncbi:MAG TPA: hypothetical protein VK550_07275 [Polyangiaceae bacterium]|nr:hypothetical protein [Polyangiaceae bacterium]